MLKELKLSQIADICGGTLFGEDACVIDVSTDSRDDLSNKLFLSLRGEKFNGHSFVDKAIDQGASGVLVDVDSGVSLEPRIVVHNTLLAYHDIARFLRDAFQGRVFSITGSNGKTSVKDWLAQSLEDFGCVLKTQSNFNNQIGVPKTLIQIENNHQFAVVEAGTSFPGEISILSKTIHADVVIVTNASGSHLEGFGSTKAIAEEKGDLITYSSLYSKVILNFDDPFFEYWKGLTGKREFFSFSLSDASADLYVSDLDLGASESSCIVHFRDQSSSVTIPAPGKHQVYNALAVIGALMHVDVHFIDALNKVSKAVQVKGRMEFGLTKNNALLIDDCYNASPTSVEAAIDVLSMQKPIKKWLVLGALGELGDQEESIHRGLGKYAAEKKIDCVLAVGPIAGLAVDEFKKVGREGRVYASKESLAQFLLTLNNEHAVLVKGSRSAKMDDIVNVIKI
ncbi:UDP-N-acetylmuramoyl-tripeptide--D-alanyl-D-alanine ligase [Marinomonas mediterranea]|uniref:UDP-N-acetylmuramoyl-tripeptide--D-alanyl-D- alanine ligase n=1 Tax=Marinomonas mediterranea TaxID=119864 RepID=UPI0023492833|nr:UDP-N-acetylmuramoyl-tripeptide--D-alanyl-D-alanine ligase [Marinomonas mediterranea]WCN09715.1 UDP-N-acetylmuramoyl-tripeptide--D-alanyl-D-alanine ligase [Marinomonas mediterranea]